MRTTKAVAKKSTKVVMGESTTEAPEVVMSAGDKKNNESASKEMANECYPQGQSGDLSNDGRDDGSHAVDKEMPESYGSDGDDEQGLDEGMYPEHRGGDKNHSQDGMDDMSDSIEAQVDGGQEGTDRGMNEAFDAVIGSPVSVTSETEEAAKEMSDSKVSCDSREGLKSAIEDSLPELTDLLIENARKIVDEVANEDFNVSSAIVAQMIMYCYDPESYVAVEITDYQIAKETLGGHPKYSALEIIMLAETVRMACVTSDCQIEDISGKLQVFTVRKKYAATLKKARKARTAKRK